MAAVAVVRVIDEAPGTQPVPGVTLRLASERISARELIRRRVEAEVAAFNASTGEIFRGLVQPAEFERTLNGYKARKHRKVDLEAQVGAACKAFERNGFIMLVDDRQIEHLDEQIAVTDSCTATFIKLTPLVGG